MGWVGVYGSCNLSVTPVSIPPFEEVCLTWALAFGQGILTDSGLWISFSVVQNVKHSNDYWPVGFVDLGLNELILIAVSIVKDVPVLDDDPKLKKIKRKLSKHLTPQ